MIDFSMSNGESYEKLSTDGLMEKGRRKSLCVYFGVYFWGNLHVVPSL